MATEQLKKIISDVHARRVVLPQFQRDFVWQPSAVIKLLVSLFNGYPVGSLLLMENNDNYEYRLIDGVSDGAAMPSAETVLVLDGQQRLTACYRAFVGSTDASRYPGRYFFNFGEFVKAVQSDNSLDGSSIEDFFIFMKNSKSLRELSNTAAEIAAGLFPLDVIFGEPRGSNYSDWLQRYTFNASGGNQELFQVFARIASRFQFEFIEKVTSYQLNYEKITRDTKPDVICTVFETINTTGVKLTVFDLLVAKSFKKGIRLRDKLEEAVSERENIRLLDPSGANISSIHLPRILGLMHNNQCRKGDILQLPVDSIANNWDRAVTALDKALGMLRVDFGCAKPEFIPSIDIISPLALILSDVRFSRDSHFRRLARLYWNLVFSSYLSGAPETKSARIVREWRQDGGYMENEDALPEAIKTFGFSADEMDEATRASVIYKGAMSLLVARGARDFSAQFPYIRDLSAKEIEDHHVFPQQFLRLHGIKGYIANSILNRTPILSSTNRAISANSPSIYLRNIDETDPLHRRALLDSHALPETVFFDGFSSEVFARFRADRRKLLVQLISEATGHAIHAADSLDGSLQAQLAGTAVSDDFDGN